MNFIGILILSLSGLLTLMGTDVTAQVYAWVIVVVLPINSALNPIIYTVWEMYRRTKFKFKVLYIFSYY